MPGVTEQASPDGKSTTITYGGSPYPALDEQVDRALSLMKGDERKAAELIGGWLEQGHLDRSFIADLVLSHISKRVRARTRASK